MTTTTVLVTGATGKTGRRVAARLAEQGVTVRPGSRSAQPPFDWEDRSTWADAVAGVDAVYLAYQPDLAVPGAADTVVAFAEQAVAAGARRLVLLSGRGEEEAERAEKLIADLDVETTVIRASFFAQNFDEGAFVESVRQGVVVLPVNDTPEPFVDVNDIADVAVAALTEDGHAGELYEVTGPRALSFPEAVAEIGRALDRPIAYEGVPADAFAAAMVAAGEPPEIAELIVYLFTTVLDGRNVPTTDGVQRAIGRAPRDFYDYAWDAARSGAWG